jgi:hypothetical protein
MPAKRTKVRSIGLEFDPAQRAPAGQSAQAKGVAGIVSPACPSTVSAVLEIIASKNVSTGSKRTSPRASPGAR